MGSREYLYKNARVSMAVHHNKYHYYFVFLIRCHGDSL